MVDEAAHAPDGGEGAAPGRAPVARERGGHRRRNAVIAAFCLGLLIALGITLYGGYGADDWRWTGYEKVQLWDWLHVLLLPVVFALVTALVSAKELGAWRWVIGMSCLLLFVALVVAGYAIPWEWTGFRGNTVWDWLGLVLLPLTLALLAAFSFDIRKVRGHHLVLITVFVIVIAVLAVGGYTQGWDWTGFEGNTLFDWLKLLFLPIVIPLVVIPLVLSLRQRHAQEHEAAKRE